MPEQAILDLPVIQFERYGGSPERLHARCIESYGLAGFNPHPDAVFHFAASLWRYRESESLKQITMIAGCYLQVLSRHVAARRRVAAMHAAMDEPQAREDVELRARLSEADEELAAAQGDLADIDTKLAEFVAGLTNLERHQPPVARRRLQRNLALMGESGWTDRLEIMARQASGVPPARVNWSAPLAEVLEDLQELELNEPADDDDDASDPVMRRLQGELEQYRGVADRASRRLQQVDDERHELERLLQDTEQGFTDRSLALEEARHALEVTLAEARERIERLERGSNADLQDARREIADLRAERDRLAAELLAALDSSTDTQSSQEELIEQLEAASSDRLDAAHALSAMSRRLEELQDEAESAAERSDALDDNVRELQDGLAAISSELSRSEEKYTQAVATIEALEAAAERNNEFESVLTESEERLAATEERLAETELRVDALTGQLDDKDYELNKARERVESQKRTIDSISVQLAEAETLTDEHDARIAALERENERLRRDLSDSQSGMLDAKGDVEEAREAADAAKVELDRVKQRLNEERGKSSQVTNESVDLRRQLREREDEIARLKTELDDVQTRLRRTEQGVNEQSRKTRDLQSELEKARAIASEQQAAADRLRDELKTARDESSGSRADAERLNHESGSLREDLTRVTAELNALRNSAGAGGTKLAELRARAVTQEQEIAALKEELNAARDLADDRRAKSEQRLDLANERAASLELEKQTLIELLEQAEKARESERREAEALIENERASGAGVEQARRDSQALREKLDESEAFLIKRQRDFERVEQRLSSLLEEVRAIADLRTKYETTEPGKKRDEIASQIGRRTDSLFAAAGKPVHADRRTEKLVILTIKKSDEEIAADGEKPFVATNKDEDSSDDQPEDEAT